MVTNSIYYGQYLVNEVKDFHFLKNETISQMKQMENLYKHPEFNHFRRITSSLTFKRNKYSHVNNPNTLPDPD